MSASRPNSVSAVAVAAALAIGGGFGYAVGASSRESAPSPAAPVIAERGGEHWREVREQLARLEAAVAELRTVRREPATISAAVEPARESQELEAVWERLSALLAKHDRPDAHTIEALRTARARHPEPDLRAAAALAHELASAEEGPRKWSIKRRWWLVTVDEVIAQFGMPSELYPHSDGKQLWVYRRGDDEVVLELLLDRGLLVDLFD
jgi:hypothetical protein